MIFEYSLFRVKSKLFLCTFFYSTAGGSQDELTIKSRKRTRNPELHKSSIHKRKVQRGEEHYSASGKFIKGKVFCGRVNCVCKNDCANKIDVLRQKELFDAFYALPNWSEKTLFLRSLATRMPVRKSLSPIMNIKKRDFYTEFFLYDSEKNRQKVCQTFILNMLQVSKTGLFRALVSQQKKPHCL